MSQLFSKFKLRDIEFKNRVFVSPMCQYSSQDGMPNDWHFVHLGSRAVGGAALVIAEASAVSPEGRITPADAGIWNEAHAQAFKRITDFIKAHNAVAGIQLAHAGRKASTTVPGGGDKAIPPEDGGWIPLAPSAEAFKAEYPQPHEMTKSDIANAVAAFRKSTELSLMAGFDVVEIHMAHGYLLHEFLSPLSNHRQDEYGGSLENRIRSPLEVARVVRETWPQNKPVFVRISATDWIENGWDLKQSLVLCRQLKELGIDLIDCSTGGNVPHAKIPLAPNYQVPYAAAIRHEVGIPTAAVGLITEPQQAEEILTRGEADAVLLAREVLRNPYWPLHAAHALKVNADWPRQYLAVKPREH